MATNKFLSVPLPPLRFVLVPFQMGLGAELVLGQPGIGCSRLGAAFCYKLRAEVAPRDQSPFGKTNLGTANIWGCDAFVLSEDEGRLWRETRQKLKGFFKFHGMVRNRKLG